MEGYTTRKICKRRCGGCYFFYGQGCGGVRGTDPACSFFVPVSDDLGDPAERRRASFMREWIEYIEETETDFNFEQSC